MALKFNVQVIKTTLVNGPGDTQLIKAELLDRDSGMKGEVLVPIADAGDYKPGDVLAVNIRVKRAGDEE